MVPNPGKWENRPKTAGDLTAWATTIVLSSPGDSCEQPRLRTTHRRPRCVRLLTQFLGSPLNLPTPDAIFNIHVTSNTYCSFQHDNTFPAQSINRSLTHFFIETLENPGEDGLPAQDPTVSNHPGGLTPEPPLFSVAPLLFSSPTISKMSLGSR